MRIPSRSSSSSLWKVRSVSSRQERGGRKGEAGKGDIIFVLKYLTIDNDPENPDEWGDDGLFLVHYHKQFWIDRKEMPKEQLAEIYQNRTEETDKYHIFPVAAYIHSGVSLSLNDSFSSDPAGWDTSHVGAICASKEEWPTREEAFKIAEGHIKVWNQYLSGEVYSCVCEHLDENKELIGYDIVSGFYGLETAKEALKEYDLCF